MLGWAHLSSVGVLLIFVELDVDVMMGLGILGSSCRPAQHGAEWMLCAWRVLQAHQAALSVLLEAMRQLVIDPTCPRGRGSALCSEMRACHECSSEWLDAVLLYKSRAAIM